jgi:hypothetical protein
LKNKYYYDEREDIIMTRDLLPIGSVIRLKGGTKKLMTFGIKQTDPEKPEIEYDYVGVCYPEGNMGLKFQYLFNHADIEEMVFKGYADEERELFVEKLNTAYEKKTQI